MKPRLGPVERPKRYIDPHHSRNGWFDHKALQQAALATTHIDHRPTARVDDFAHHRVETLVLEAQRRFESILGRLVSLVPLVGVSCAVGQAGQRGSRQRAKSQVALGDEISLGVLSKPFAAATQQLLHFILANPVVLLAVEYGQQHI